jgi:uncharacterized protein (DUF305 family)
MKRNVFHPSPLDGLEVRLVPSGAAASVPALVSARSSVIPPSHPKPSAEAARFEVRWMKAMISRHGMAIEMARLAVRNSDNPEVVSLARGIIRAQTREIGRMQTWLKAGYGIRGVRPRMTPDDMQMLEELGSLRGAAFDRAFLGEMIEHHRAAVGDAQELLAQGFHRALRQLGENIITTQTAEIGTMQTLLARSGGVAMAGLRG